MAAELLSSRSDATLVLTLSNPGARNALHPDIYAAGVEALGAAERDPSLRAIVLTGADNFFTAGGNLHRLLENRAKNPAAQGDSIDMLGAWVSAIRASSRPVIGAIEGAAAGAGFALALSCDLLVAAENAKFVMSYAKIGVTPDGGSSWFAARSLPRALASELIFEGRPIEAPRLHALGIVNRVVAPGTALDAALEWARDLAQMSPQATTRAKGLIDRATGQDLPAHLQDERETFLEALQHRDALEGMTAFLEKRAPDYK